MIKINLLPRTINEKAIIRNTAMAFAVVLIAILVGGFTYASNLGKQVAQKESEAQAAEAWEQRVQGIQKQAQDQRASVKPIQDKLDFINAVLKFNQEYPTLYAEVAKWTYNKVMYTSMTCDGATVTMNARTKNLDYLGRYLLNMYRATDVFTEVTISGVPGYGQSGQISMMGGMPGGFPGISGGPAFYPGGGQASLAGIGAITSSMQRTPSSEEWIEFAVVCKLKTPIAAPSFAGAAVGGAQTQSGASGVSGPPGMPGGPGMPGASGMPRRPMSGGATPATNQQ